jgi:hypothetical protein
MIVSSMVDLVSHAHGIPWLDSLVKHGHGYYGYHTMDMDGHGLTWVTMLGMVVLIVMVDGG